MARARLAFILWLGLGAPAAWASLTNTLTVDIGAGTPQLISLGAQFLVRPWLQIGFGYGAYPFHVKRPDVHVDAVSLSLIDGKTYYLDARDASADTSSLAILNPYIRVFPSDDNFYFQFAYTMLRMQFSLSANLVSEQGGVIAEKAVTASMSFTQPIPTLSIGKIYAGNLWFVNFSLGASFLLGASASVELSTALPNSVGGDYLNQDAVTKAKADVEARAVDAANEYKKKIFLIPSIYLSVGLLI